jgi:hypothetical protein
MTKLMPVLLLRVGEKDRPVADRGGRSGDTDGSGEGGILFLRKRSERKTRGRQTHPIPKERTRATTTVCGDRSAPLAVGDRAGGLGRPRARCRPHRQQRPGPERGHGRGRAVPAGGHRGDRGVVLGSRCAPGAGGGGPPGQPLGAGVGRSPGEERLPGLLRPHRADAPGQAPGGLDRPAGDEGAAGAGALPPQAHADAHRPQGPGQGGGGQARPAPPGE